MNSFILFRSLLLLTAYTLFLFGCSTESKGPDEIAYDCLIERSGMEQRAFEKKLNKLEQLLIRLDVLEDSTGKAYHQLYERIERKNALPYTELDLSAQFPDLAKDTAFLKDPVPCQADPLDMITHDEDSKANKKWKRFQSRMDEIENPTPSSIAKVYVEILEPKDFESGFFRAATLLHLIHTTQGGTTSITVKQPPPQKVRKVQKEDPRKHLSIKLTQNDKILLEGDTLQMPLLKERIKKFIRSHGDEATIQIQGQRGTSYHAMKEVEEKVTEVGDELLDQRAQENYDMPFDSLNGADRKKILEKMPKLKAPGP